MFENIPRILPNEIFFSWLVRSYEYHPFIQSTFLKKQLATNSIAPYQIKPLAKDYSKVISTDQVIEEHSTAMLFKAFLPEDLNQKYIEAIKDSGNDWRKNIPCYDEYINEKTKLLHVCSLCYQEDIVQYGTAYLHVEHQLRGLECCYKHKVNFIKIICEREGKKFYPFYDIDEVIKDKEIIECTDQLQLFLAQCAHETVNEGYLQDYNLVIIQKKYRARIKELGYWKSNGIDHPALQMAISSYYGEEKLAELGINLIPGQRKGWTYGLTTSGEPTTRIAWHFLLIGYLFNSIQELIKYEIDDSGPFGKGPWECLNKWCEKYKMKCIKNIQYRKGREAGTCIVLIHTLFTPSMCKLKTIFYNFYFTLK